MAKTDQSLRIVSRWWSLQHEGNRWHCATFDKKEKCGSGCVDERHSGAARVQTTPHGVRRSCGNRFKLPCKCVHEIEQLCRWLFVSIFLLHGVICVTLRLVILNTGWFGCEAEWWTWTRVPHTIRLAAYWLAYLWTTTNRNITNFDECNYFARTAHCRAEYPLFFLIRFCVN